MEARTLLDALLIAERLKDTTRHCYTAKGRHESVAEHTWMMSLMAFFVKDVYLLEDDYTNSYCYPAMIETKDGFLVAYYHSNNSTYCLNSSKITKVYRTEIE